MRAFTYLLVSALYGAVHVLGNPIIVPEQHDGQLERDVALQERASPDLGAGPVKKPFYAIAHRCNDMGAVQRDVNDGANAIEIDLMAQENSAAWWAAHDEGKNGNNARDMFNAIAGHRKAGKPITFVWLDLKNPDKCDPDVPATRYCSIVVLRDMAREILEPVGVRVLFGFYKNQGGKAAGLLRNGLTSKEAINIDGRAAELKKEFTERGPADVKKRIASYGWMRLQEDFGNCWEAGDAILTCTQLRQEVASRAFGKVFAWTVVANQGQLVDKMLGVNVDGLIYGLDGYPYGGSATQTLKDIRNLLAKYPEYYYAGVNDSPW